MAEDPSGPTERIARRIARAGVCSRRDAEKLIIDGRVTVNGVRITSPALNVGPRDAVSVDGKPLAEAEPTRLWRHHKRRGRITAARDPQGRPTVFDDLPAEIGRVIAIGRLDFNTEGLLLLTNDGALARTLELPATGWLRRYRVRVHGAVDEEALAGLAAGITLDGVRYGPIEARLERRVGSNAWLEIGLREGKNREVRKVLAHLGLAVTRLIRVSYGPFQLGSLPPGAVAEMPRRALREQLGGLLPEAEEARPGPRTGKGQGAKRGPAKGKRRAGPAKAETAGTGGPAAKKTLKPKPKPGRGKARPAPPRGKGPRGGGRARQGHADHRRAP